MHSNIAYVSAGVASLAVARSLWVEQLGMTVVGERFGPDPALAELWGLAPEAIVAQVLLASGDAPTGNLHLVEFAHPGDAVRAGAAPTDLGAKNLDANCIDMHQRVTDLQEAGYSFRSTIAEYDIDGITAREVQMPIADAINLVLIEVLGSGFEVEFTPRGFAALTSFVVIVPDVNSETDFYRRLFGMEDILHHKLSGEAIEIAAGLPTGTVLDLYLLGEPDNLFGRMELIEYVGIAGDNRFARAVPPATGILSCGFKVDSLQAFATKAAAQGVEITEVAELDLLVGHTSVLQLSSPAGLKLEIIGA